MRKGRRENKKINEREGGKNEKKKKQTSECNNSAKVVTP